MQKKLTCFIQVTVLFFLPLFAQKTAVKIPLTGLPTVRHCSKRALG